MSRQRYAERPAPLVPSTTGPARSHWNVTTRRIVARVLEQTLGECLAPTPRSGLLVLVTIIALLAVIAVTLSIGNALLVLLAGTVMRISCERRRPVRAGDR